MVLSKLVMRGPHQYHKIESAKVYEAPHFSDGETSGEADTVSLLERTDDDHDRDDDEDEGGSLCAHDCMSFARKRKALPQDMEGKMKLVIRKLDDSTFNVEVSKRGTVLQLKHAVEMKFEAGNPCFQISWPHVWGNFCFSFNNRKLVNDSNMLHGLGIREHDELHFVRHLTMSSGQRQRRGLSFALKKKHRRPISV